MLGVIINLQDSRLLGSAIIVVSATILFSMLIPKPALSQCTNWVGLSDNDCDGLANTWEITGYDINGDSVPDLILPGANPEYKDIYMEIDFMQYHKPRTGVVEAVYTAFRNAPVSNPNGTAGINLHYLINEQIPHQSSINVWSAFDTLKDTWFGASSSERSNPLTMQAKDNVYHYALFIHQYNSLSSSGVAELPGDDLVVSLGATGWGTYNGHTVGSVDQQTGTLMHELGHNLGLRHGGNVDENCKPNYLSVMSYSFQFSNYVSDRPLDYSRSSLAQLDESSLIEQNGISPASVPSGMRTVYGPSSPLISQVLSSPANPINWDRDSNPSETVAANINNLGSGSGCSSTSNTPIGGYHDWLNLKYWGTTGGWYNGTNAENTAGVGNGTNAENTAGVGNGTNAVDTATATYTNTTNLVNGLITEIPFDSRPGREGMEEMNVQNLLSSRGLLLESIVNGIDSLPQQDLRNNNSKVILKNMLKTVADKLNLTDLTPAINGLRAVRELMDSSLGGNPLDDLVINPNKQKILAAQIDNLVESLRKQQ